MYPLYIIFSSIVLFLCYKLISLIILSIRSNSKGVGLLSLIDHRGTFSSTLADYVSKHHIQNGFVNTWAGGSFTMVAVDPESAKFVLHSTQTFPKKSVFGLKYTTNNFGSHLVNINGDVWKRHRTYANPAFNQQAYQSYFDTFSNITEKALNIIETKPNPNPNPNPMNVNNDIECRSWLSNFTIDLLGNSVFHYDFGRLENKSNRIYEAYNNIISSGNNWFLFLFSWLDYLPIPPVRDIHNSVDYMRNTFLEILEKRKNGDKHNDILDKFLSGNENGTLSQVELLSDVWVMFVAGHETTASALTSACQCLVRYPDIQEKLYQEIYQTIGNNPPTFDDLNKLQYLDCFIHEVLRTHPPIPYLPTRIAVEDTKYKDQLIPKGSNVAIMIQSIHNHEDYWSNPEKFDPDRFLPENKKGRHHYSFLPFSVGPRQCIGNNFSLIEQRLFLTRLIQKFRVLPPKNHPFQQAFVNLFTSVPVYIHFEPRL